MKVINKVLYIIFSFVFLLILSSCNKAKFNITFIVDEDIYWTIITDDKELIEFPVDPEKVDYIFDGWYWDKDTWLKPFTVNSLLDAEIRSDMKVYAKFLGKDDPVGTELKIEGFELIESEETGDILYCRVKNVQTNFSFSDCVNIYNRSTWTLSKDVSGNDIINSKTVTLDLGDNLFYIQVKDDTGKVKQYNIVIRRNYIYNVDFNVDGGVAVESANVEEGGLVNEPITSKPGYTFKGWDYDFNNPIMCDTTINAIWEANVYTITLDANGGDISCNNTVNVTYDQSYQIPEPVKKGYSFAGWYYNGTLVEEGIWKFTENCTFNASWTIGEYNIYYELNGGENDSNNPSKYTYDSEDITINAPTKLGHTFVGWTSSNDLEPIVNLVITKNSTKDRTLTAHWKANEYKLTLDGDGADSLELDSIIVSYGQNYKLPVPTKQGYEFLGWYHEDGEIKDSEEWLKLSDCTLIAKWKQKPYVITCISNNESKTVEVMYGDEFTLDIPEKLGFSFNGYYMSEYGKGEKITDSLGKSLSSFTYTSDITIYASFIYAIKYMTNGGNEIETVIYSENEDFNKEVVTNKKDRTFAGWYIDSNLTQEVNYNEVNGNCTLYAKWEEETSTNYFTYEASDSAITIKGCSYTENNLIIPSHIAGLPVTKIDSLAFQNMINLFSVEVPDSVTIISDGAFKGCNSIQKITLPFVGTSEDAEGTSSVFGYIFGFYNPGKETSSTSGKYMMSSSNEYINQGYSFIYKYYNSSYTRHYGYYVPKTIKEVVITTQTVIPTNAFYNCDLIESITIPETVTSIGENAFYNCNLLKRLNSNEDGLFNIPTKVIDIKNNTFSNCLQAVKFTMGDIETIGDYAFYNCSNIEYFNSDTQYKIEIPNSVISIGVQAFYGILLITELEVSDSVTIISDGAFKGCNSIQKITLPFVGTSEDAEGTSSVFGYIFGFYNPGKETSSTSGKYMMSSSNEYINQGYSFIYKYYNSSYTRHYGYYVPKTIKEVVITTQTVIPTNAFYNCDLIESITIPETVTSIGENAFYNCNLLKRLNSNEDGLFNIPTKVIDIKNNTFSNCLQAVKFTMGDIETIGDYAFYNCSNIEYFNSDTQYKIEIPNSVISIGVQAFYGILLITELEVSDSVTIISDGAFKGCNSIQKITLPFVGTSEDAEGTSSVFGYIFGFYNPGKETSSTSGKYMMSSSNEYINQGYSFIYKYYNSSYTRHYGYYVPKTIKEVVITTQTVIPTNAFYNCDLIESITIPETVTSIGENAFYNCNGSLNYTYVPKSSPKWDGSIASNYHSGSGIYNDPYIIFNPSEFAYFAQEVNNGNSYENTYFKLSSNIRLNNKEFSIIGSMDKPFKGYFNGNGYIIKDFTINSSSNYAGLFGYVDGVIENVGIENMNIKVTSSQSGNYYAGMVGYLSGLGIIRNVYTTGSVTNDVTYYAYAGGLVGYSEGLIEKCYSTAIVTAKSISLYAYAGGLVGKLEGKINYSFAMGDVTSKGANTIFSCVGGLVGDVVEGYMINSSYRTDSQVLTIYDASGSSNEEGICESTANILESLKNEWYEYWDFNRILPMFYSK